MADGRPFSGGLDSEAVDVLPLSEDWKKLAPCHTRSIVGEALFFQFTDPHPLKRELGEGSDFWKSIYESTVPLWGILENGKLGDPPPCGRGEKERESE